MLCFAKEAYTILKSDFFVQPFLSLIYPFLFELFRLKDDGKTENAAKTGVVETTEKPTMYTYPGNDNIKFWDLPGIGMSLNKCTNCCVMA